MHIITLHEHCLVSSTSPPVELEEKCATAAKTITSTKTAASIVERGIYLLQLIGMEAVGRPWDMHMDLHTP